MSAPAAPVLQQTPLCLCLASRRAARTITRAFDRALKPHRLKATQFTLLAVLALAGEQPIGALARLIVVEKSTMVRNAAVAEREGLVTIRRSPDDARLRLVAITEKGRQRLDGALRAWNATQTTLTAQLGEPAARGLRALASGSAAALG